MTESEANTILKAEIVHHPECSIFAYRGIGTPEELQDTKRDYFEALSDWRQYCKIGTLEECRTAREKQIPMKPDFTEDKEFALCPCCNGKGLLDKQKYCDNCGQKIDWSDEE